MYCVGWTCQCFLEDKLCKGDTVSTYHSLILPKILDYVSIHISSHLFHPWYISVVTICKLRSGVHTGGKLFYCVGKYLVLFISTIFERTAVEMYLNSDLSIKWLPGFLLWAQTHQPWFWLPSYSTEEGVEKNTGCFNILQDPYKHENANQNIHSSCLCGPSIKNWNSISEQTLRSNQSNERRKHQRGPLFPFKAVVYFPSEQTLKTDSQPNFPPQPQCGRVQTHHIFKDQSQGFLGVDDVMEEHDVGMLQAFQKRRCRHRTDRGKELMLKHIFKDQRTCYDLCLH